MRISHRQILLAASVAVLLIATSAPVARANLTIVGTGSAGAGNIDPVYTFITGPTGGLTPTAAAAYGVAPGQNATSWIPTPTASGALWITPVVGGNAAGTQLATGFSSPNPTPGAMNGYSAYIYQVSFTGAQAGGAGTYNFSLSVGADDDTAIVLNNVIEKGANPGVQYMYTALTPVTFTATVNAGTNTLDFLVYNTGQPATTGTSDGPTGLLVSGIAITAVAVPEPSTLAMAIGGGVFGLGALVRRRRLAA